MLASIGATTSDLINSALDYVISAKELPCAKKAQPRDIEGFGAFVDASTLVVDWPNDFEGDYKALMRDMRLADYEALD